MTEKEKSELIKGITESQCWKVQKTLEVIEQSIYIFEQNYNELFEFVSSHQDYNSAIDINIIYEFNRLLFNFLSSIFTFTEHRKLWFKKENRPKLPYNTEYLFVKELRNITIHKEFPKTKISFIVRRHDERVITKINKDTFIKYLDEKINFLRKNHKQYSNIQKLKVAIQDFEEEIDIMYCCTKCYDFVLAYSNKVVDEFKNRNKDLFDEYYEITSFL